MNFQELDALIEQAMTAWPAPGLAGAIVHNEDIFMRGYGVRSLDDPTRVDERTIFAIASCTKAFTALALQLLAEEGRLTLDDPVTAYFPEFQLYDPYVTREITVRDLLCHRSGLQTFGGDLLAYGTTYSRDEILWRIRYLKPTSSFRSQFGYQNIMYVSAGHVVEAVSGTSWDSFIRERILLPLGMTSSTTSVSTFTADTNLAQPHIRRHGMLRQIPYLNVDNEAPGGGINSNVLDMLQWVQLQLGQGTWEGKSLVSAARIQEMWSPHTIIAPDEQSLQLYPSPHFQAYGLGWFLRDYQGRKVIEHSGGLPGMVSLVVLVPEEQLGFVLLSNGETAFTTVVRNSILDHVFGVAPTDWSAVLLDVTHKRELADQEAVRKTEAQRVPDTHPSLDISQYVGDYTGQLYGPATVGEEEGKLVVRLTPAPSLVGELEHWHYDTFRVTWRDPYFPKGFVTFILDAQAKVTEMKIDTPNPDFDFKELELHRIRHDHIAQS
ncbi:MAG: serine hydrolase [Herpetosiphonaceae bacterium]|nr:serine hydrolase [Herpetosiphonaceae bacterium]